MSKIDPKLENFIISQLKKGRDVDLIKNRLKGAGWAAQEIEDALTTLVPMVPKQEPKPKQQAKPEFKKILPQGAVDKDGKKKKTVIATEDVVVINKDGKSHMEIEKYEVTEISEKVEFKSERLEKLNQDILQNANLEFERSTLLFSFLNLSAKQRLGITKAFFVITLIALLLMNGIEIFMFQYFEYGAR